MSPGCDRGEELHRLVLELQPRIDSTLARYRVPPREAQAILAAVFDRLAVDHERLEPSVRRVMLHLEARCRAWAEAAAGSGDADDTDEEDL